MCLVLSCVFICGCRANPRAVQESATVPAAPAETKPVPRHALTHPGEIRVDGLFVHPASGMEFPETVGSFRRTMIMQYDSKGEDVSVNYDVEGIDPRAWVTVYDYPVPAEKDGGASPPGGAPSEEFIAAHFDQVEQAITLMNPRARRLVKNKVVLVHGAEQHIGLHVMYRFDKPDLFASTGQITEAFLFVHGARFIKFRVSYPEASAQKCSADVRQLMQSLRWPKVDGNRR
jgi:hypothetical protein